MASYRVNLVSTLEASSAYDRCRNGQFFSAKGDIYGVCVKLITSSKTNIEMWTDNFAPMGEGIRSHAMIIVLNDPERGVEVDYDPVTSIAVLYNFDYYGWIKSIALAVATDILEDSHNIFAVHGAALDLDGIGVSLIAPSKTGKTTQSWGLLRVDNAHLITDDWFFVRLTEGRPRVFGSEKNCYIDADIGDVWDEYKPLVNQTHFDNKGRGIANVRWVMGPDSVVTTVSMRNVVLLKRDKNDSETVRKLNVDDALYYLVSNDFCNPHQMIRDERKMKIRTEFFRRYLSNCEIFMINTVKSAEETQDLIREALGIQ